VLFLENGGAPTVARALVRGKIRNQRAVLLYFAKGLQKNKPDEAAAIEQASNQLAQLARQLKNAKTSPLETDWRSHYLGFEGKAAALYWRTLRQTGLMPPDFPGRTGRGATDVGNQCLNLGYAILMTHVWHAVTIAGLEPYLGILHVDRPGKPSLVLDIMEEYRPWVVDRNVIKLRFQLAQATNLDAGLRKAIIGAVHANFLTRMAYSGKKLRLSAILQRQVYRLCGVFHAGKAYKPYLFKW
jgi:CRISPR-associated protein Cas1